jgi:GxxExxY protein
MTELIYEAESYAIRGACFEVYKEKGFGFLESVYQECLEIELELSEIPFIAKPKLQLAYKDRKLKSTFEPDFMCYEKIVLELKAVSQLADEHRAQLQNYLKATGHRLGFLINFGQSRGVQIERIAR